MSSEAIISAEDLPPSLRAELGRKPPDELKHRIHDRLVRQLDLAQLQQLPEQNRRGELRLVVTHLLAAEAPHLDPPLRETVVVEVIDAHPAGDHTLYISRVEFFEAYDEKPLIFYASQYQQLRAEKIKLSQYPQDEFSLFSIGSVDPPVG